MYRMPSRRRKISSDSPRLNLVPMVDAMFNILFFILITSAFISILQIPSPLATVSDKEPPLDKPPLALTLSIDEGKIIVSSGIPSKTIQTFQKSELDYPWDEIHLYLIDLKKKYPLENTAILEPDKAVAYKDIIKLMDAARVLRREEEALYGKDTDGVPVRLEFLFENLIFGNITG